MATFFQFEADFVESLRCIPMQVRYKLDTCGVKLKLAQWNRFSQTDCQALVDRPCETATDMQAYRQFLQELVAHYTGSPASELAIDPHPAWTDRQTIPDSVQTKAAEVNVTLLLPQWAALSPLQRFALIKLSRSGHENNNFLPALQEFGLL
ncbi:MAG: nitrate reductase associated protein [Scytolyngbya sp. HA4215-MV1]|jgi:hypothetical protein|nr:nitrate reductase associated protein [Scytolyngbya sp. HA4215-MV1]